MAHIISNLLSAQSQARHFLSQWECSPRLRCRPLSRLPSYDRTEAKESEHSRALGWAVPRNISLIRAFTRIIFWRVQHSSTSGMLLEKNIASAVRAFLPTAVPCKHRAPEFYVGIVKPKTRFLVNFRASLNAGLVSHGKLSAPYFLRTNSVGERGIKGSRPSVCRSFVCLS